MARFDAFVLFAEMRTGSNNVEETLNAFDGIACLGEVWNPTFIGNHTQFDLLGYDMARRAEDPVGLLDAIMAQTPGLPGFRFFHDHDPRVLERVLPDPRIAKVVLLRNPLDAYVSRKIATETGQWRLTDARHRRDAKIHFDEAEFAELMERLQAFQLKVLHGLQTTGQTAFYLGYEDIGDADVLNGLAAYLGVEARIEVTSTRLKRQNPAPLEDKVENYADMVVALTRLDRFDLSRTPYFEPRRHPGVPGFVALPEHPLLFVPVAGGPVAAVTDWLAAAAGIAPRDLVTKMSQKDLRRWLRQSAGHHVFSVVRHPVARAHHAFTRAILPANRPVYADARRVLRKVYRLPIPEGAPGADWSLDDHRTAFVAFLRFLKAHLAGQTNLKIEPVWGTQTGLLQAAGSVLPPARIVREDDLGPALAAMASAAGLSDPGWAGPGAEAGPYPLAQVYDDAVEAAASETYRRDYLNFGFDAWQPPAAAARAAG